MPDIGKHALHMKPTIALSGCHSRMIASNPPLDRNRDLRLSHGMLLTAENRKPESSTGGHSLRAGQRFDERSKIKSRIEIGAGRRPRTHDG